MSVVLTETAILTDIANAIRQQNGGNDLYRPGQMAAAVAALDGTRVGTPRVEPYMQLEKGLLSTAVFEDIDAAIRAQDGSQTPYTPSEMAAAILALTWDTGLKVRALLLTDGTLEFNYRSVRSSDLGTVSQCWTVDPSGYASDTERPWHAVRTQVRRVAFDSDFSGAGMTNLAYWCKAMTNLTEVLGFEECSGATDVTQMFLSCGRLETIWATSFDNTAIVASSSVLYGCNRLVGGSCFVPSTTSGASALCLGASGVLTSPGSDLRRWVWGHLYDDGGLVVSAASAADPARTLLASGRVCVNAHYTAINAMPWYEYRSRLTGCTFLADLAAGTIESMDYWFYAETALASVAGWANVRGLESARFLFNGCLGLTPLDMTGLDPSALTDLTYMFSGCSGLTTILVDAAWALPAGASGYGAFAGCTSLVGGNGTVYDASRTGASMAIVDSAGSPGYLTGRP